MLDKVCRSVVYNKKKSFTFKFNFTEVYCIAVSQIVFALKDTKWTLSTLQSAGDKRTLYNIKAKFWPQKCETKGYSQCKTSV